MTDSTRYALKPTLRVGQVWKSGEGKKVTITQKTDDDDHLFPFDGSDGRSYTSSGSCFDNTRSKSDLVELLSDAPTDEWQAVYHAAAQLDPIACCLSELRDRVVALEAAGGVAGNPGYAFAAPAPATADGLSPVEPAPQSQQGVPSAPELWELARVAKEQDRTGTGGPEWDDSHHIHQRDHIVAHRALFAHGFQRGLDAPQAQQGVTYEELMNCLPIGVWHGPVGYNSPAFAQYLLDHPRLGPLLRGEGAPAPKRVVLPEAPTKDVWNIPYAGRTFEVVALAVWAAARAEVERQQGGQADG